MTYDGEQMELAEAMLLRNATREEARRILAILAGAAAAVSGRIGDEMDLGTGFPEPLLEEQRDLTHLLMRIADRHTPLEVDEADGGPGEAPNLLEVALAAGREWRGGEEPPLGL